MPRPYTLIAAQLADRLRSSDQPPNTETRMRWVVDALWESLHSTGVSWVGFYLLAGTELVLGPMRNKPACSPIGLHGACGHTLLNRTPLIVGDVRTLGANYIACDPRDLSEVVLPLVTTDGSCTGVLDLDSHTANSFDESDVDGLRRVLRTVALTQE